MFDWRILFLFLFHYVLYFIFFLFSSHYFLLSLRFIFHASSFAEMWLLFKKVSFDLASWPSPRIPDTQKQTSWEPKTRGGSRLRPRSIQGLNQFCQERPAASRNWEETGATKQDAKWNFTIAAWSRLSRLSRLSLHRPRYYALFPLQLIWLRIDWQRPVWRCSSIQRKAEGPGGGTLNLVGRSGRGPGGLQVRSRARLQIGSV